MAMVLDHANGEFYLHQQVEQLAGLGVASVVVAGTAARKNMSPANIQNAVLAASPLIAHAVAIGDRRPYIAALIVLDPDAATLFAARHGLSGPPPAVLAADPAVRAAVCSAVETANGTLSRVEQIKRFAILPVFWEPGGDEITLTMKLKRQAITAKYADIIESLYAAASQPAQDPAAAYSHTTSSTALRLPAANLTKGDPP
jgi:long-chain acyl-CoA synthetase